MFLHNIILPLFLCLAILIGCSKVNKYESEEQKAFNDVFREVIKDDYESVRPYMNTDQIIYYPSVYTHGPELRQEIHNYSKYPEKYDSVISEFDNYHKPFFKDFTRLLVEAKGNKKKIDALLESASEAFDAYSVEIFNKSKILLYTDNKLQPFRDTTISSANQYYEKYDSSYFYKLNVNELEERNFNYSLIRDKGRIEIKVGTYPDKKARKRTPEIEIGIFGFSRIAFNPDFTKGKFILFFGDATFGDRGTSLIYINKLNGRWHYKSHVWLK
ncbi:MAG: hypothetical protein Q8933_14085 [Bacteroidota bacterium]|nr:hypothetical protein [Bacteroidota bacterium]